MPTPGIYEQAVARLVRGFGLVEHVHVLSFTTDLVRRVQAVAPEIRTSLVFEHPAAVAEMGNPESNFPKVTDLHPKHTVLEPEFVARAREAGLRLHAWTINEPADLEKVRGFGVESVTTDEPERILAALGREKDAARLPKPRHGGFAVRVA